MESITDLPFTAEYAKSSRSSCKGCKMTINKDELRLGIMVQSPHFDGKIPNWFHGKCFWKKSRVKTEGDIHGFDNLRWDDQEEIRNKVKECDSGISGALKNPELTDFAVEYAVSGRAKCKGCIEKIENKCLRISRMDYDSKGGRLAGGVPAWYHVDCFVAKRDELEFWEAAEKLPGFAKLSDEDQKSLKSKLKSVAKKRKAEPDSASADGPVDAKKAKNGDVEDAEKVALKVGDDSGVGKDSGNSEGSGAEGEGGVNDAGEGEKQSPAEGGEVKKGIDSKPDAVKPDLDKAKAGSHKHKSKKEVKGGGGIEVGLVEAKPANA